MTQAQAVAAKKPLLERVGITYFERRSARTEKVESGDAIHILNPDERKALKRVTQGTVARAALAGALSSIASAIAELVANDVVGEDATALTHIAAWWLIVMGVTIVASIAEIAFLYWDTLRSVHELARQAGLKLFEARGDSDVMVATVLARAALELPNPIENHWGINPRREASKWRLLLASLLYKAKIGLTNFIFKALVRRMLGRVLLRRALQAAVPFVAVPVTAAWNGYVAWRVMREARLRAMGPSAIHELVQVIFSDLPELDEAGRVAALRAVGAAIVRTQDLHPNLLSLFDEVAARAKYEGKAELDDPGEFLRALPSLSAENRRLAIQVLAIACIVDGELVTKEKKLYAEALAAAGREITLEPLEKLCRAFVAGDGWADEAIRAL
ncbi:MAG: hypothetical protein IPJ65_35170 [Archangiaceae bacterium]|nr:hypothetical protein [Archangiaceae bacterium]